MKEINLTDKIWLKKINNKSYSLIFEDDSDFMMTMTGYDDENFSKIAWVRPNGCDPIVVGETKLNDKPIKKIIQDSEANYIIYV